MQNVHNRNRLINRSRHPTQIHQQMPLSISPRFTKLIRLPKSKWGGINDDRFNAFEVIIFDIFHEIRQDFQTSAGNRTRRF